MTVLDRHHTAGGEAAAVADTVDLVDDRVFGIAGPHEIPVQGVYLALRFNGSLGCYQCLTDDLTAENALPADLGAYAAKQVYLDGLQIKGGQQGFYGFRQCGNLGLQDMCDDLELRP